MARGTHEHDHASHPEEHDIVASFEQRGGKLASSFIVKDGDGQKSRREPSVEDVLILLDANRVDGHVREEFLRLHSCVVDRLRTDPLVLGRVRFDGTSVHRYGVSPPELP